MIRTCMDFWASLYHLSLTFRCGTTARATVAAGWTYRLARKPVANDHS